ncbi:MAG: glutamate-5-semialdehyde dehydrogenase [Clostridiales bacterium]|nr:glutamate-5-semialdehyde dehydrogenase [Clostridiales bacterium]
MSEIVNKAQLLKKASLKLSEASTKDKNDALKLVGESLIANKELILKENEKDIEQAIASQMKESLIDRLRLTEKRIQEMVEGIKTIIELKDPIWKSSEIWTIENGLNISKMTVPLGVVGIIYESRPNVTVDAFSLTLKSGNCILLRGSSSAIHSNKALVAAIKEGLRKSNISEDVIQLIENTSRESVMEMLKLNEYIDVIIPRGGNSLIQLVVQNATVPTIETGVGNCHVYIDKSAKLEDAVKIVVNAKTQRPGVCNACETVLVHEDIANTFLPMMKDALKGIVELRGCDKTREVIDSVPAVEEDWAEEYLDYILAVKVVKDVDEAIEHIGKYGTMHSESIVTEDYSNAEKFLRKIDAAAVYVNASTRFTDGSVFGFGCEMGISTQKMHARGPMGLNELVTIKYIIRGNGQIRE